MVLGWGGAAGGGDGLLAGSPWPQLPPGTGKDGGGGGGGDAAVPGAEPYGWPDFFCLFAPPHGTCPPQQGTPQARGVSLTPSQGRRDTQRGQGIRAGYNGVGTACSQLQLHLRGGGLSFQPAQTHEQGDEGGRGEGLGGGLCKAASCSGAEHRTPQCPQTGERVTGGVPTLSWSPPIHHPSGSVGVCEAVSRLPRRLGGG